VYFIITGTHDEITEQALSYLHPTNLQKLKNGIITFDTKYPERLNTSWFIIKWGILCENKDISDMTSEYKILWAASKDIGIMLKKQLAHIRRFKLVDLIHSDMEIKKEGVEVVDIDGKRRGIVQWYQNIPLYEAIDFGKPVGGMGIGMMPSKLAHTLINIWIGKYETKSPNHQIAKSLTIWDPFCGFGTTNFLINHLWYNTICSDINITQVKKNMQWRWNQKDFAHSDLKSLIIKHDVTATFPLICHHADIIVSEWRLWHVVSWRTAPNEVRIYAGEVEKVYQWFFDNLNKLKSEQKTDKTLTLVITIPNWIKHNISISQELAAYIRELWRDVTLTMTPYSRKDQLVGRQVMIASK
jgi:hypothetical protein